ncbi:MAG: hypothetical protein NC339_07290 [Muribaculaceae bacterium]|nr:hypothetical protein [Muribaculaceae bacterium]
MYVISSRVKNTLDALPATYREPIRQALEMDFVQGKNPETILTPIQGMVYAMIRFYVAQDTARSRFEPCGGALS